MKKIGFVFLTALTLILAVGLATSVAAPSRSEETCFKVDVTDAFKGASGDVSGECPGATVTSVCLKAATEIFCSSNACFTINYSGSSWSVSENWPGDEKGPECHDVSWYKVCYECPPPPPSPCDGTCEVDGDCEAGLVCHQGACRNPDCPEETDCLCPPPPAECNEACEEDANCGGDLVCHAGICRNPACPEETDCLCPPPPPAECDESCEEDTDCSGALVCYEDACRNPVCPEETDCLCPPPPPLAKCNQDCTEVECTEGLVCIGGVCRNPDCPEETDCSCPPPACYPRLNIYALDCVPEGLVISCYFEFDENNFNEPTGKKYIDKPWEKNPFIVDLDKGRALRCWGWTAEGGFVYFFNVPPIRECPKVIDKEYRFPCPVPTPTPTPELPKVLPVTGIGSPPTASLPNPFTLIGLGLIVLGGILRRMRS